MKQTMIAALLLATLVASPALAQDATPAPADAARLKRSEARQASGKLSGFQDLRFGTDPQAVIKALSRRYRRDGNYTDGTPKFVGTFGGYQDSKLELGYDAKQLTTAGAVIYPQGGRTTAEQFFEVAGVLTEKYGIADAYFYTDRDGAKSYDDLEADQLTLTFEMKTHVSLRMSRLEALWTFGDGSDIVLVTGRLDSNEDRLSVIYTSGARERIREAVRQRDL